jgi:MFS family permease
MLPHSASQSSSADSLRYFDYPTGAKLGIFNGTQGLGGVFSQFFLWWLVEKIGRKYTIIIGSVIIILGVFLQTFANGLVMFAVARAIIGLGLSFEYTAAPMLVTELAHPTHRAQLSTFLNTLYNFGATIAAWVCLGTLTIQSDWSWRSVSLIQIFPSLISVALTWWVPESPSKSIPTCSTPLIPSLLTTSTRMACFSGPRSRSARDTSHPSLWRR